MKTEEYNELTVLVKRLNDVADVPTQALIQRGILASLKIEDLRDRLRDAEKSLGKQNDTVEALREQIRQLQADKSV